MDKKHQYKTNTGSKTHTMPEGEEPTLCQTKHSKHENLLLRLQPLRLRKRKTLEEAIEGDAYRSIYIKK